VEACPELNHLFQPGTKMAAGGANSGGVCPYPTPESTHQLFRIRSLRHRNRILGGANGKVRKGCRQERQERNAPSETWHASLRPKRERRPRQEPQAGHCHRSFRSSQERSKGSPKALELFVTCSPALATLHFVIRPLRLARQRSETALSYAAFAFIPFAAAGFRIAGSG
jgi:hypothetical protein